MVASHRNIAGVGLYTRVSVGFFYSYDSCGCLQRVPEQIRTSQSTDEDERHHHHHHHHHHQQQQQEQTDDDVANDDGEHVLFSLYGANECSTDAPDSPVRHANADAEPLTLCPGEPGVASLPPSGCRTAHRTLEREGSRCLLSVQYS